MPLNINAGSLRDKIEWYQQPEGTDEYGASLPLVKVYNAVMGNVRFSSGAQLVQSGAEATDEVITVLTWYDPRITNSLYIRFDNRDYQIQHIKPDELRKGMIVTAKINRDG